ncbi:MAG: PEGA domain-containing protein, partial [Acidobacteriota bacterium]
SRSTAPRSRATIPRSRSTTPSSRATTPRSRATAPPSRATLPRSRSEIQRRSSSPNRRPQTGTPTVARPNVPGLRATIPSERAEPRTRPTDRPRTERSRPPAATDRPVFRPYNGSLDQERPQTDREILSPDRRRRIEIQHHDNPRGRSPSANLKSVPSSRSDHSRRSRSRHHSHRHHHHYGCGHYGYGYRSYYNYSPFYSFFSPFYRYSPYYYSPYTYHYPSYYRGYRYYGDFGDRYATDVHITVEGDSGARQGGAMGALDVDIKPQQAEIFVDGYLVGEADQFDGYPNYLWLEEGTYELAFYREGYETIFRQYTIYPGVIIDIDDKMYRGESIRPQPPAPEYLPQQEVLPQQEYLPQQDGAAQGLGPVDQPPPGPESDPSIGRILVAGSPADAAVYLDGHFVGTAGEIAELTAGLIVEPGDHVVELVRPGFETQSLPIAVPAGEQVAVNLSLIEQ